ncbi:MAG: lysophospholipid acyltransferase family protein [Phycisphaeraceae bacterium]|nr:lysophospholipid acyltransferase family protein [Phycisphaeraceae bacterium]
MSAGLTLRHAAEYAGLRAFAGLMHAFSPEQNLRTASTVGRAFHRLNPKRGRRANEHLELAFPDAPVEFRERLAEASIENMFRLFMVESVVMPQVLNVRSWPRHVRFGSIERAMDLLLSKRPALLVTGHCGNWELLGFVLALLGFPMTAIARPLDNPYINRWLLEMRESRGLKVLTKWGATDEVQKLVEQGGRIGFIADQNAGDDGIFVPFFGRLASAYKSIGLLAMRHRVPIVVGAALREGEGFHYRLETVDLFGPEEWESHPDPLFYITARYTRGIETSVRMAPEQYLWIHRRWKSRPRWERSGRPMPDAYREKIRSLPWLDAAELDRLLSPTL